MRIPHFFNSTKYWAINSKYYKNFVTSLCNSVMPKQKAVCENQCTVYFKYSVILNQLIPCIGETVEEEDTAPLFKIEYINKLYMSRLEQLGVVLESTQLKCMLTHFLTAAQERKIHPACTLAVLWLIRGMRICFVMLEMITSDASKSCTYYLKMFKLSHFSSGLFPE